MQIILMNTICNLPDIDIYLLLFLDIKRIMILNIISKNQNALISELDFIKELRILRSDSKTVYEYLLRNKEFNYGIYLVDYVVKYNHVALLQYIHDSSMNFVYSSCAINFAAEYGNIRILKWFYKYKYEFIWKDAINVAFYYDRKNILRWLDKHNLVDKKS